MNVYLITEKSDFSEEIRLIFDSYEEAKAYVHDEVRKFKKFVEDYPDLIGIEPKYEELSTRFEEPVLDSTYIGTLFVDSTCWDLQTPVATVKVSKYPTMSYEDGELMHTPNFNRRHKVDYFSYGRRNDE